MIKQQKEKHEGVITNMIINIYFLQLQKYLMLRPGKLRSYYLS